MPSLVHVFNLPPDVTIGPSAPAYTQTFSTASRTVPAATAVDPPAGGTGATAGAYDTAGNRNLMIASLTAVIADVAELRKVVTALIDDLQAARIVS